MKQKKAQRHELTGSRCGTRSQYQHGGCRCADCKEAEATYKRYLRDCQAAAEGRSRRRRRKATHGTRRMRVIGCRCIPCVEAYRTYERERKERQRREAGIKPVTPQK